MLRTTAYQAAANGEISSQTLSHLEKVAAAQTLTFGELVDRLESERMPQADRERTSRKIASKPSAKDMGSILRSPWASPHRLLGTNVPKSIKEALLSRASSTVKRGAAPLLSPGTQSALLVGTIAAGAPLVAGGVYSGVKALHGKITEKGDLNQIMNIHPGLKQYDPKDIQLAFQSVRRFAPEITKDPLAGGNALGTILRARDPMTPGGPPELSGANIAESFSRARMMRDPNIDAVMGAATSGINAAQRVRDTALEHSRRQQLAQEEFGRRGILQEQQAKLKTLGDFRVERLKTQEALRKRQLERDADRRYGVQNPGMRRR